MYENAKDEVTKTNKELWDYINIVKTKTNTTKYDIIKLKKLHNDYMEAFERYTHLLKIELGELLHD